jgi:pimeloyl-ACP methyl ester carboxylesterase
MKAKPMPLLDAATTPAADPPFPAGVVRLDYRSPLDDLRDWAMLWPQPTPGDWLICIHGHGSRGDQLFVRQDVRDLWLPAFRQAGLSLATLNLRGNAWMSPAAVHDVAAVLDYLRATFGAKRFLFASGSMGGTANLIYAVCRPQDVAGLVALCPATDLAGYYAWCRARTEPGVLHEIANAIEQNYGGPPAGRGDVYHAHSALRHAARLTMPLFLSHGDADAIIPVAEARALVQAIGPRPTFFYEELPGGHHDTPLTSMPKALIWVLRQMGR